MSDLRRIAKDPGLLTAAEWYLHEVFSSEPRNAPSPATLAGVLGRPVRSARRVPLDDPFPGPSWLDNRIDAVIKASCGLSFEDALDASFAGPLRNPEISMILRAATNRAKDHACGYGQSHSKVTDAVRSRHGWKRVARAVGMSDEFDGLSGMVGRGIHKTVTLFLAFSAAGQHERAEVLRSAVDMLRSYVPLWEDAADPSTWYLIQL